MGRPTPIVASVPVLRRLIVRLWPQIRTQRKLIGGAFVALFLEIGFRLLEPWPLGFILDRVIPTQPPTGNAVPSAINQLDPMVLLGLCAAAVVVFATCRAGAAYLSTVGFALAGNRVLTAARSAMFSHLQRLSLSFHAKTKTGDMLTRVLGDIGRLQEVTVTAMLPLLANVLILIGMLAVMVWMNWQLSLIALIILPLFFLISRRLGGRIHGVARQQREREGQMGATAAEAISAIKVVQALSLEDVHDKAFAVQNKAGLKEGVRAKRLSARLERSVDVLIAIGSAAVLFQGARLVMLGALTPGQLIIFLAYMKNAFKPMRDMAKYTGRIAKAAASADRILEVLETTPAVTDGPGAVVAPTEINTIQFANVGFEYEPGQPAIADISFEIGKGQAVALVGPSGAGKSTIINLLLRLYDAQSGSILWNGQDLREFTVESLRNRAAVVPQDDVLFAVSIRANIAYGLDDVSDEQVIAAAQCAQAHEFITALPDGYDTVVGERGETLSGGERQRIAIARAAVRDARILVFDEPLASVDSQSATLIRRALHELRQDRIMFLIAHDLSMVEELDLIVYLEKGRIIEHGSHAELITKNGRYAEACRLRGDQSPEGRISDAKHAIIR